MTVSSLNRWITTNLSFNQLKNYLVINGKDFRSAKAPLSQFPSLGGMLMRMSETAQLDLPPFGQKT